MQLEWLTKHQKWLEKEFWVTHKLNKEWKMYLEENTKYKKYKIEQEFQETIKQITAWYTQAEIDTWNTKVTEAKKVISGWKSDILNSLLIKWETVEDLATTIIKKADEYSKIYYQAEKTKREKLKELKDKNKE